MLAIFCGIMAFIPPLNRDEQIQKVKDDKKQSADVKVLNDPQSIRYKIGEIKWKKIKR